MSKNFATHPRWSYESAVKLGDGVGDDNEDNTAWKQAQEEALRLLDDKANCLGRSTASGGTLRKEDDLSGHGEPTKSSVDVRFRGSYRVVASFERARRLKSS